MEHSLKKTWYLDRYCALQFAALTENGKLAEFYVENEPRMSIVGNVYKGKIVNVLSGINAAFVNCGLAKNCYLSLEETYADYNKYDGTVSATNTPFHELKEGDEVIVQVIKPPRGNKGARVSTQLSLVGKHMIYLPDSSFLGISRKITDEIERERLLDFANGLREQKEDGFIIRTQAPFADEEHLVLEAEYLKRLHQSILDYAELVNVGDLLYEDDDLPARIMRDCFGDEVDAIHVGDEALYRRLCALAQLRKDLPQDKLHFYPGPNSMLHEFGVAAQLYEAARPTVSIAGGAYIVIERTEAMTVIDVNSGGYVGERNLEETALAVNLAAAEEIARQMRLLNIGGLIVVDFIDLALEENRQAVTQKLTSLLNQGSAKCNVLPMNELGLVQFTRKRVGNDLLSFLSKPCPHCASTGYVEGSVFTIARIRSALLAHFANGNNVAYVDLNEKIMKMIMAEEPFAQEIENRWQGKEIYFIPHKTYKDSRFIIHGEADAPQRDRALKFH